MASLCMAQTTKEILAVQLRTELKPQLSVAAAAAARGPSALTQDYYWQKIVERLDEHETAQREMESQTKPHDPREQVEVVGSPDTSVERFPCSLDRRSQ